MRKLGFTLSLIAAAVAGAGYGDDMTAAHRAAADRVRTFVYNSDGCDMLYYPEKSPLTIEGFTKQRLTAALGTKISTISYCPLGSGFGYFTSLRVGDPLTNTVPPSKGRYNGKYNATLPFWEKYRTDALEMALAFARTNGFERFMSIRMNDSHDGSTNLKKGLIHPLFSPFRRKHPECLMGSRADGVFPTVCRYQWTCCNYAMPAVRDAMRRYVREFCENYDMEGLELDFCRHPCFFKSVAWGEPVRTEELEMMTDLLRDIRKTTLSYERKKGHPILLSARVPDSVPFCRAIGLDIPAWLKEKLLDAVNVGCYFDLEDPQPFVELAHASGVKCFVSIDETRIPRIAKKNGSPLIDGRDSVENYLAHYAAAMSTGCDGIHLFNLEHKRLTERTGVDPRETDGLDKIYFATERGAGGWPPSGYLKDGFSYKKLPRIEPTLEKDEAFRYGKPRTFDLRLGDDFAKAAAKGLRPVVSVLALVDANAAPLLTVNGRALPSPTSFDKGLATFACAEPSCFKKGINRFTVASGDGREGVLRDFAVRIAYEKALR